MNWTRNTIEMCESCKYSQDLCNDFKIKFVYFHVELLAYDLKI